MTRRASFVWCCALGLLSGCRVGPDYRAPAKPAGAEAPLVSFNAATQSPSEPPDDWWKLYNDAHLDALVREAFTANTDLAAAEANLSAAAALLSAAKAGRYPDTRATVSGTFGRDRRWPTRNPMPTAPSTWLMSNSWPGRSAIWTS